MKTLKMNQSGIGHIVLLAIVVVVAVVGFVGWRVLDMNKPSEKNSSTEQVAVPDTIKSKDDLVQTSKALDESNSDVNSGLNDSQLDADLNDML